MTFITIAYKLCFGHVLASSRTPPRISSGPIKAIIYGIQLNLSSQSKVGGAGVVGDIVIHTYCRGWACDAISTVASLPAACLADFVLWAQSG
jgi:hypothetical protein